MLVSASHDGVNDVDWPPPGPVRWTSRPPKLTVVLDKMTKTRELIEQSGCFVIQVPTAAQLQLTYEVGNRSLHTEPDKLANCGVELF
ncbi:Uncharacterised protein [Serratia fonticola]|uniref:Uncharacterized protein n=1 Tax=Serratia fonticola TaxID=47917 RepID=A0A4U9VWH9_SERFO|nr:Uncharacterised protein [Serratia fonticola]